MKKKIVSVLLVLLVVLLITGSVYAKPSKPLYGNAYFWYSSPDCTQDSLYVSWYDAPPNLTTDARVKLHVWLAIPRGVSNPWLELYNLHETITLNYSHTDHSGIAHFRSYEWQYPLGDDDVPAVYDSAFGEYTSTAMVVYETSYIEWSGGPNVHLANPYDSSITRSFYTLCSANEYLPYNGKDGDYPMGGSPKSSVAYPAPGEELKIESPYPAPE